MRVRAKDANGDFTFGRGGANYLVNTPAVVGQLLGDRFGLWTGEWFIDQTEGTPWTTQVLGKGTTASATPALRKRALQTTGVTQLVALTATLSGRAYGFNCTADTVFSKTVTVSEPA
jgi:hypothetical protein